MHRIGYCMSYGFQMEFSEGGEDTQGGGAVGQICASFLHLKIRVLGASQAKLEVNRIVFRREEPQRGHCPPPLGEAIWKPWHAS